MGYWIDFSSWKLLYLDSGWGCTYFGSHTLGICLHLALLLYKQVVTMARCAFYQLWLVRQLRTFFDKKDLSTVTQALVTSKLAYCNMLYVGQKFQLVLIQECSNAYADGSQQIGSHHPPTAAATLAPAKILCPVQTVGLDLQSPVMFGNWVFEGPSSLILLPVPCTIFGYGGLSLCVPCWLGGGSTFMTLFPPRDAHLAQSLMEFQCCVKSCLGGIWIKILCCLPLILLLFAF